MSPSPSWRRAHLPCAALLLAAAAILICCPTVHAVATFVFSITSPVTAAGQTSVEVLGRRGLVLRVRGADAAQVSQRAVQLAQRLNALLDAGLTAEGLALRIGPQSALITGGGAPIITITAADAAANATTVDALARGWLLRLREAFREPYFAVPGVPLVVPLQGEITVPLSGPLAGQVALASASPSIVEGRRISPAVYVLRGLTQGEATATFAAGGISLRIPLSVLPPAARIVPGPTIRLSGSTSEDEVRAALAAHLRDAVRLEPGCSLTLEGMAYDRELLERTGRASLYVGISASGPGFAPLRTQVSFALERGEAPQRTPLTLWVSNSPENVARPGPLLRGEVPARGSVRVFYHHLNVGGSPLALVTWAIAAGGETTLHLLGGASRAQGSPIAAGRDAALGFLRASRSRGGFFVTLSGARAILLQTFNPGETASALYELTNDSPQAVGFVLEARQPNDWEQGPLSASLSAPLSRQALYPAERRFTVTYRVGEDWGIAELGREGELSLSPRMQFRGGYGVVHRIRFRAVNNSSSNTKVELACYAGGGKTLVVYQLDGSEPRVTPLLPAYGEARLAEALLATGQERVWELVTLPVGGCFYPVSLLLRPAD